MTITSMIASYFFPLGFIPVGFLILTVLWARKMLRRYLPSGGYDHCCHCRKPLGDFYYATHDDFFKWGDSVPGFELARYRLTARICPECAKTSRGRRSLYLRANRICERRAYDINAPVYRRCRLCCDWKGCENRKKTLEDFALLPEALGDPQ